MLERNGEIQLRTLLPFEEGKPLNPDHELVELRTNGALAEIKFHGKVSGPAKVNSPAFKEGWGRIFNKKKSDLN